MPKPGLRADEVKAMALEAGLDSAGIAPAGPDAEALGRASDQIGRGLGPDRDRKTLGPFYDPGSELAGARSVLVVANSYLTSGPESLGRPGQPHGRVARYDWCNYYRDTREKLQKVADRLSEELSGSFQYKIFSNGRLAEKPLAARAGLGWYGKHGIITTAEYGSWIVLGLLVTNLELEPDVPLDGGCGDCRACMDACPTGAIVAPGVLDCRKCLQWMSGRQMVLPREVRLLWGDRLYGCTDCQEVCPLNKKAKPKNRIPEYGRIGPSLPLIPILGMEEGEFRSRYRGNQMAEKWVSFEAIRRNAAAALGNIGDQAAVPALERAMQDGRSQIVSGHAAWALGRIGGGKARGILDKAAGPGLEAGVIKEVHRALGMSAGTTERV